MNIQEIARLEQVSERQIQRYCRAGYKGHVLPATRSGRGFVIAVEDYKAWRVECGFDFLPQAPERSIAAVSATEPGGNPPGSPADPAAPKKCSDCGTVVRPYPPYPMAADPHGVPTNVPHEHSSTMPHPQACADYFAEQARKIKAQMRGYEND
jgi:hypothetical protein